MRLDDVPRHCCWPSEVATGGLLVLVSTSEQRETPQLLLPSPRGSSSRRRQSDRAVRPGVAPALLIIWPAVEATDARLIPPSRPTRPCRGSQRQCRPDPAVPPPATRLVPPK